MNHKIEHDGRGGRCVNDGCTLNLTFLSSIDITYLENNNQCPTGPLKKLMRQPSHEEIVGDHKGSQRIHTLYEDALKAMRRYGKVVEEVSSRCPSNIEVIIDGVIHPNDNKPEYYIYDCCRVGSHSKHMAKTWNPAIWIEWTDDEFIIHRAARRN